MANRTVLVPTSITAENVKSRNRVGVSTVDVENGTPLVCGGLSTNPKKRFVFEVEPATDVEQGLWMSYSPESIYTRDDRAEFGNIQADVREFYVKAGDNIDMFKPEAGVDLIQVSIDFFADNLDPDTVTGATYVEISSAGEMEAVVSATANFAGLQFKILTKEPIVIATGALGGEGYDAWILECTNN